MESGRKKLSGFPRLQGSVREAVRAGAEMGRKGIYTGPICGAYTTAQAANSGDA